MRTLLRRPELAQILASMLSGSTTPIPSATSTALLSLQLPTTTTTSSATTATTTTPQSSPQISPPLVTPATLPTVTLAAAILCNLLVEYSPLRAVSNRGVWVGG